MFDKNDNDTEKKRSRKRDGIIESPGTPSSTHVSSVTHSAHRPRPRPVCSYRPEAPWLSPSPSRCDSALLVATAGYRLFGKILVREVALRRGLEVGTQAAMYLQPQPAGAVLECGELRLGKPVRACAHAGSSSAAGLAAVGTGSASAIR